MEDKNATRISLLEETAFLDDETRLSLVKALAASLPATWIAEQIGVDPASIDSMVSGDGPPKHVLNQIQSLLLRLETDQIKYPDGY